jgi:hypothetical protein
MSEKTGKVLDGAVDGEVCRVLSLVLWRWMVSALELEITR